MFASTQMGGVNMAFPDVCLTPMPPFGIPAPIPYPNVAAGLLANPGTAAIKVLTVCMPTHNMMTMGTISMGDTPGVMMGVMSAMIMGPHRTLIPAFTTLMGGLPTSRLLSMMGQNGLALNIPGVTIAPAQPKVLVMK
ncbi:MAG: DUF4150 domain-containing protein [SAR324 cluster bacterium]|nr:DUF4150 domain-containing protein [SAR324 cluster bacterium]